MEDDSEAEETGLEAATLENYEVGMFTRVVGKDGRMTEAVPVLFFFVPKSKAMEGLKETPSLLPKTA